VSLMAVSEALARVLAQANQLPPDLKVPLADAHGRVLTADVPALRTQPPASLSAMDGYAVRALDVTTAPVRLRLIGEVAAGRPLEQAIGAGEAARIFTGGLLPSGADAVVVQESASREQGTIIVQKPARQGQHVRTEGLDFRCGELLLRKGHRLSERDLALAAAMNHAHLPVHHRPRLAMFGTGDELVMPGSTPGMGQIVYSNGYAITALARREGCDVIDLGIVADRIEDTVAAVRRARDQAADILVSTGGASVGDYDLVQRALAHEGLVLSFWRVAMRPGRPMLHGRLGPMHVMGLPGNPVSAYVCAFLFLVPLIRRLAGRDDVEPRPEAALLACDIKQNDERTDYLRARLMLQDTGLPLANPVPVQDSSMLSALAAADCLLIREPHAPAAKAGAPCSMLRLNV
jgi:molybdopterin molybdotransferase